MIYFFKILEKKQIQKLAILSILLFFGMLMESLSLVSVFPLISVIFKGDDAFLLPYIPNQLLEIFDLITIVITFVCIVFILKAILLIFLYRYQNLLLSNMVKQISDKLYKSYLDRTYSYFVDQNTSEIIKKLQIDIQNFFLFTQSVMIMTIEMSLAISVLISLLLLEPVGAFFSVILFLLILLTYNKIFKSRIVNLGIEKQKVLTEGNQIIFDSISGIKDLIILNKTNFFKKKFNENTHTKARVERNFNNISQIPRLVIELFALVGILLLVILQLKTNFTDNSIEEVLGLFAAGVFKLIPSANKILMSLQIFKYTNPSLELIYKDLDFTPRPNAYVIHDDMKFNSVEVKNLIFGYNNKKILKDLNIQFFKNEAIGIYGGSGSGKSTFIDVLMGLQKPVSGTILYNNTNVESIISISAYVPQKVFFLNASVSENIAIGDPAELIDIERIDKLIDLCQLRDLINDLEFGLDSTIGEGGQKISGGQRQRIGIARALYQNPKILILDESTNALDEETERKLVTDILKLKSKVSIIFISHNKEILKSCDRIYKLEKGTFKSD